MRGLLGGAWTEAPRTARGCNVFKCQARRPAVRAGGGGGGGQAQDGGGRQG